MGLHGPLPATRPVHSHALDDDTPPDQLGDCGQTYYRRHFVYLTEAGLLTEATQETYTLCCALYERLRDMDNRDTDRVYLDTLKAWQSLCKQFRLTPTEKPSQEVSGRYCDSPKFGDR